MPPSASLLALPFSVKVIVFVGTDNQCRVDLSVTYIKLDLPCSRRHRHSSEAFAFDFGLPPVARYSSRKLAAFDCTGKGAAEFVIPESIYLCEAELRTFILDVRKFTQPKADPLAFKLALGVLGKRQN